MGPRPGGANGRPINGPFFKDWLIEAINTGVHQAIRSRAEVYYLTCRRSWKGL